MTNPHFSGVRAYHYFCVSSIWPIPFLAFRGSFRDGDGGTPLLQRGDKLQSQRAGSDKRWVFQRGQGWTGREKFVAGRAWRPGRRDAEDNHDRAGTLDTPRPTLRRMKFETFSRRYPALYEYEMEPSRLRWYSRPDVLPSRWIPEFSLHFSATENLEKNSEVTVRILSVDVIFRRFPQEGLHSKVANLTWTIRFFYKNAPVQFPLKICLWFAWDLKVYQWNFCLELPKILLVNL